MQLLDHATHYQTRLCFILISLFSVLVSTLADAQPVLQQSHIEANVPDAGQFESLLKRDLLAHFKVNGHPSADRVEYKLLRDAPTQSGVAYPKFYAWVVVVGTGTKQLNQGAVRVASVEKVRFEVTQFISKEQVKTDRDAIERVFPAALVPAILQLASEP
jgi:hypothetical protein